MSPYVYSTFALYLICWYTATRAVLLIIFLYYKVKFSIRIAIAYLKSIIQGIDIKSKQVQEYLGRKTEYHRKYARHSTFYIGLWGESWVDSMSSNWQVVVELMSLSAHKLPNYQQGLRAMRLILSAL